MNRRSKKKHKSRKWVQRHVEDTYVKQAVRAGYRARAVYKLEEIDQRYRLIRPGINVLDLGAAPGSWSQYAAAKTGLSGKVIAIDLLAMESIENVTIIQDDFCTQASQTAILELLDDRRADIIISDMSPDLTGIRITDQANMERLLDSIISTLEQLLKPGGDLLMKVFEGEVTGQIRKTLDKRFVSTTSVKPKASRNESREYYLLARGHQPST